MAQSDFLYTVFQFLLIFQYVSALFIFCLLFFVNAPYGKHLSNRWGPTINHRVGWVLMEFPAFAVVLFFFLYGFFSHSIQGKSGLVLFFFLLVWEIHYVNRTFIYPFQMAKKSKPMALVIPFSGFVFNLMNGFINGYYFFSGRELFFEGTVFEQNLSHLYQIEWLYDPRFILGLLVFILGMGVNLHSDWVLRKLRKPGETGYKIPQKGFHKWVASPNYFGEFTEWTGFALMTWSLPALAFALYTFGNLGPRAWNNRKWYRKNFGDQYPKKRRAMIPFIF